MITKIKNIEEFKNMWENNNNIVLDFWAEWCGPCVRIAPLFQELSDYYDNIVFCKINIEDPEFEKIVEDFSINSLPTFVVKNKNNELKVNEGASQTFIEEYKLLLKEHCDCECL